MSGWITACSEPYTFTPNPAAVKSSPCATAATRSPNSPNISATGAGAHSRRPGCAASAARMLSGTTWSKCSWVTSTASAPSRAWSPLNAPGSITRTPPSFSSRTQACPSLVSCIVPPRYRPRQTYSCPRPALLAGSAPETPAALAREATPRNPPLAYGRVPSSPGRGRASGQAEHAGQGAGRRAARLGGQVERGGDVQVGGQQTAQFGHGGRVVRHLARGRPLQRLQPGGGGFEQVRPVLPALRPGPVQDHQPYRSRGMLLQQVAEQHQVAGRLGHLGAVDRDHAGVEPGPRVRVHAGERLGHRGVVGVVWEAQFGAARVHVHGGT